MVSVSVIMSNERLINPFQPSITKRSFGMITANASSSMSSGRTDFSESLKETILLAVCQNITFNIITGKNIHLGHPLAETRYFYEWYWLKDRCMV